MTLGKSQSGWSPGSGSTSKTSSAAPAICAPAEGVDEVVEHDDRPPADVDEIARRLHLGDRRDVEQADRLGRVGGGDDDEVALGEEVGQGVQPLDRFDPFGRPGPLGEAVDGDDRHPEGQGPPGDLGADRAQADDPHRRVGQEDRRTGPSR